MNSKVSTQASPRQMSLQEIIGVWLLVAVPMAVLSMGVAPWLIARLPYQPTLIFWACMILGMAWQFVVSLGVLWAEGGDRSWPALKGRLWLNAPRNPATDEASYWVLVTWTVFGVLLAMTLSILLAPWLDDPFAALIPSWLTPAYSDVVSLAVPENTGAWHLLWFALVSSLFNYFLGEALFFHCILLPRMQGAFGRWAWVANGVMFTAYHIHKLTALPTILISTLIYAYPGQRYKSAWPAILIHGVEGIVLIAAILFVILGGLA